MTIQELRSKVERLKGQVEQIQSEINKCSDRIAKSKRALRSHEQVREIIRQVGIATQQQLVYNIREVVTLAMDAVLENPYDVELEFVERRGKTECDIYFTRGGGHFIEPYQAGGGAVDVASFALRVASWSMQSPRTRSSLILDEPFKHLKGEEANRKALDMVREIAHKLGIQIIMVSDERVSRSAIVDASDRLFVTSIKREVTKVETDE